MKLLLLGDFYFDYDYIPEDFENICYYIRRNDLKTVVNLESSLSGIGKPIKKRGPNLCSTNTAINALLKMNTVAVTLANNHIMDYGSEGLSKTIKLLTQANIEFVGAGNDLNEAEKIIEINDNSSDNEGIILLNYGWNVEETIYATKDLPGCAPLHRKHIVKKIAKLREQDRNKRIILFVHWGFEYNTLPMPLDIKFAHKCIDAGCDLIIGSHPHVVQPMELYKGNQIYYSLGNFYFGSRRDLFRRKFIYEENQYYSGIGAGVVLDTESWSTEPIKIIYDYDKKNSNINDWEKFPIIRKDEYDKYSYKKKVKLNRVNHNPILTGKLGVDSLKILILMIEYKVYSILKGKNLLPH